MTKLNIEDELVTVGEVARAAGCSPRTVRNAIQRGALAAVRPGGQNGRYRVRVSDYRQWLTDSKVKVSPLASDADVQLDASSGIIPSRDAGIVQLEPVAQAARAA